MARRIIVKRNVKPGQVAGLRKQGFKKRGPKFPNVWVKKGPKQATVIGPKPAAKPKRPEVEIPYSEYSAYPWAQRTMASIDRDQKHHEGYASGVGSWLGSALAALTGVDPSQPGYNPQVQQQYLANVAGQVGGALNAAAVATPMTPSALSGGAIVQGNNAFLGQAARDASAARSSAALQEAQARANLNTLQPNIYAQGAVRAFADLQAGLPGLYASRRAEARNRIDEFIMEFEEQKRAARVGEAIRARESDANIALAYAQLGLDQDEFRADQAASAAEANADVPYGYVRLPDGRYVRDPQVPAATSGGGGGGNRVEQGDKYTRSWFIEKGWKQVPAKAGKGYQQRAIASVDGSGKWIKPASGSGSGGSTTAPKRLNVTELEKDLLDLYKPGDSGGWEERYDNDPKGAGAALARWVRENKVSFIKPGRKADLAKIRQVLRVVGGRPAVHALDILTRGYISPNGTWK